MAHSGPSSSTITLSSEPEHVNPRVLLAACGSIAAVGFTDLCGYFAEWADVKAVVTRSAMPFINRASFPAGVDVYTDENDWATWKGIGNPVLHMELAKWAQVMVIAPLSANTLGKISMGLCDNLLTCLVRSWDTSRKHLFVAPDMNPVMWDNTLTERHTMVLDDLGICLIRPVSRDSGDGSMEGPSYIMSTVRTALAHPLKPSRGSGQ